MVGDVVTKSSIAAKAIARSRDIASSDTQLQSLIPDASVYEQASANNLSCAEMIDCILSAYSDREALGTRDYEVVQSPESSEKIRKYKRGFRTQTYGDIRSDIRTIASAWRHVPTLTLAPDEFLIILGFASSEYFALDCAASYAQGVSVPMQIASSGADLDDIFERIQPSALAASFEDLSGAIDLASRHKSLRSLIIFDIDLAVNEERQAFEAARQTLAPKNIRVVTYAELIEAGKKHEFAFLPPHPEGDDRLALIIHSSGSTGVPKGAMISEGTVKQYWISAPEKHPTISVIFSPLNHLLGRATLLQTLGKGSTAYFTLAPDMSTLFEDIRLARPTQLTFFPRVLDMIYQHYQNEVVKQISGGKSPEKAKTFVMEEMRDSFLGDRLTTATVGSAPTSQAVKDFMVECFGVWMLDGYGSTEAGAGSVTINGFINRKFILDYKLRDVPELGYYGTDKPHPRGEFCFKGKNQIKGFFMDPEATKDLLTDDGYIITGDIVEDRGDDRIVIVDRRKDVVKLSQGEYVAVGSLGTVYEGGSPFIKQVYLYGNSHRSYLVAVVVPDIEAITHDLGQAPNTQNIRHVIRQAILEVANREKLKSFEAPRDFIVEMDAFSQENGLLSSVRKKLRPSLKKKYSEALEALYDKHTQSRDAEIEALKNEGSGLDISEKLKRLMIIHLGLEDDAVISDDKNFTELGGDSLGAVNFSLLVEDVFSIIFPADKILDPTGNVRSWERDIKTLKSSGSQAASFASVHGPGSQVVEAKDLSLDAFLPITLVDAANSLSLAPHSPKTVLLTGATGFLGRHVCLEWLAQLEDKDSRLICLVRANDNETAHKRLTDIFENSTPDMREAFKRLSEGKLEILAADISMPDFGLTPEKFKELGQTVDRICHVGALVNHRLSYEHLFAPNVAGTAEILKLALTHNRKPIDFVSTVSVLSCLDRAETDKEKAAPAQTLPLSDAYASGYATSKWAAEVLLRKAAEKSGVPVNILRGNMMLSHRKYVGAINPSDMFTRLLFSLISTGIAPQSFYTGAEVNYDGLPVDLIASCIVSMGHAFDSDVTVMNADHYHTGNDFSLDAIARQIKSLGYKVDTIDDYEDWFGRFSDRLNALPEAEKQKSALDLLPAFKHPQTSQTQSSVKNFRKLVNSLAIDTSELASDYIAKIIDDMNAIGLLPASTNYFIPKEN